MGLFRVSLGLLFTTLTALSGAAAFKVDADVQACMNSLCPLGDLGGHPFYQSSQLEAEYINKIATELPGLKKLLKPSDYHPCIKKLATHLAGLPSHEQNVRIKNIITVVKQYSISVLKDYGINASEYIKNINVTQPMSKEDTLLDWKIFLRRNSDQQDMQNLCNPKSVALEDMAYPAENRIDISPRASLNVEISFGIIAHEIGHFVYNQYYQQWSRILSCLTNKSGHKKFNYEDFSDWFSAQVIKKFEAIHQMQLSNTACAMNYVFDNAWQVQSLNAAQEGLDPYYHSSALFRAISLQVEKQGVLPNACRQMLAKHNRLGLENACK